MSEAWLDDLFEAISSCWEWHSPALQVGFRYGTPEETDDFCEVWAFPAVQEILGGKEDGETVFTGFNFDVMEFLNLIQSEAVGLTTRMMDNPSELHFEGKFQGKDVLIHICLEPPEDAKATEVLDLSGNEGPIIREKD